MDAQTSIDDRPLYVDLDGTLIASDLLQECLLQAVRSEPWFLLSFPRWHRAGKARVKQELARRATIDPANLPYRPAVIAIIEDARAAGRRIILATGADRSLAEAVSNHLGLFDEVIASDGASNMTGDRKLARIRSGSGFEGFDYLGNSHEDIAILEEARAVHVVAPDRAAGRWQRDNGAPLVRHDGRPVRAAFKALRPHQWAKNTLLFVPFVIGLDFLNVGALASALLGFVCFCLAASSIYIINDLFDIEADRSHRTKRYRPFAAGRLSIKAGLVLCVACLGGALAIAALLPLAFRAVLSAYLVTTLAYSIALKRMLLIDVLALAGLYMLRVMAGEAAIGVAPSFWLLAFSLFFFMSLALVKRYTELEGTGGAACRRTTGRGYVSQDLETLSQAGMTSGFASVLVLALYINSDTIHATYGEPYLIWPLCPLVLYIIVRIWVLARRSEMHEDPVVFILNDWRSQFMIAAGAALLAFAAWY